VDIIKAVEFLGGKNFLNGVLGLCGICFDFYWALFAVVNVKSARVALRS